MFGWGVKVLNDLWEPLLLPPPPLQFENMSVVVDTLRVNGNSLGKSKGNSVVGAGSVYNSFKLFAKFLRWKSHDGGFSKKYLKSERRYN